MQNIESLAFSGTPWLATEKEKNPLVVVGHILIDGTTCKGKVIVPETVTSIANGAFLLNYQITEIVIPPSVTNIGETVFEHMPSMVLYGKNGSYVLEYAKQHNITFKEVKA